LNHVVLEVEVLEAPQVRYTQDNQTPIAEVSVQFDGLRPEDPAGQLKLVGWGSLAQDLQNRVHPGQRLVVEGRLRMNTVTRQDGVKEKRAEFTLSRLHPIGAPGAAGAPAAAAPAAGGTEALPRPRQGSTPAPVRVGAAPGASQPPARQVPDPNAAPAWNTAPLVPDFPEGDDDIPF
jgi:single-stranded DNA-binding protein